MEERIQGLSKSMAGKGQRFQAPRNWIGSETVNLFQIVFETLDLIEQLANEIAIHQHGASPVPTTAAAFTADGILASVLSGKLKSITL